MSPTHPFSVGPHVKQPTWGDVGTGVVVKVELICQKHVINAGKHAGRVLP